MESLVPVAIIIAIPAIVLILGIFSTRDKE